MRIYHICHLPDPTNGIFYVLMALPAEQRKLGNDVKVFNLVDGPACNDAVKYGPVAMLKRLFVEKRPDLVVFHGVFYKEIHPLSRTLGKLGIPYLVELHGALSRQNMTKSRLKKLVARALIIDRVIRNASAIVYLNSNEVDNSTIRHLNARNVIIPNGCSCPDTDQTEREKDDTGKKRELLFLGRIDRNHKGLDILVQALRILLKKDVAGKTHVSFYGNGFEEDMQWLETEVACMKGFVDYYGPVYGEDKARVFRDSDIFLLTSRYEGFPMAVLEALSFGIPCLVTPATNVADIILENDCGWVTPLDAECIAEAIASALAEIDKREHELASNALSVSRKYDWESIARLSIKTYADTIGGNHK